MLILSYENEISFTCKLNSFSYEWLCTRPRFEREALGNSEMVYLIIWVGPNRTGPKCYQQLKVVKVRKSTRETNRGLGYELELGVFLS